MDLGLIIQLLSGALGGNVAGKFMKESSLGTLGNSIAGIVGGFGGGQILGMLSSSVGDAAASGSMDPVSIISSIAGGGVGGGIVMAIIGVIKKMMAK